MSDYEVRLRRYNAISLAWETAYSFEALPFVSPTTENQYVDLEPPLLSGVLCRWKVQAKLYGADSKAVSDAWAALRAAVESTTTPAHGIQLVHGSTVLEEISTEGGYVQVKIESISSPQSDPQWTSEMVAIVTVSGLLRKATVGGNIADLTYTLSYSYDEAGLLTKTADGQLTVTTGSAEAAARTMGLQIPSDHFGYVTRGPEGTDVKILDQADRTASFTSSIREAGDSIPSGVGPGFSLEVETITVDGETVTTTTVSAEGPDAVDAVKGKRPGGKLTETQRADTFRRTASAVYVTKKALIPVKRLVITASGGGRSTKWSRRTGGRAPVKHLGSFAEVIVDEQVVIEKIGQPGVSDFKCPAPVIGLDQDTGSFRMEGPNRIEIGKDLSGDKWQVVFFRRYTAPDFQTAFNAYTIQAFAPGTASDPGQEVARIGKGTP